MNTSVKKWLKLIGLGTVVYTGTLIATFPAHLGWQLVPQKSLPPVQIQGLDGSIWQGKASTLTVSGMELGKLNWDVQIWPLIFGKLSVDTHINNATSHLQTKLALSPGGKISAENLRGIIQMPMLNRFTLPVSLQGALELNVSQLNYINSKTINLTGQLNWHDASIDMVQSVQLGEVAITAQNDNDGTVFNVKNSASALAVEGSINIRGNGQYKTNLAIFNRDANRADINNIISMVGKPNATGRVYLKQQGKIPLKL
ncbi:MAG: type II secretion system protein N [Gammaproteobacteria bacterium]|nr:type II secretion system protein N [Gammaproteobacteria bacterium]